jgi:hypothetical protein
MVASSTIKEATWFIMLLQELGFPQKYAITILNNSQGSFVLIRNPIHHLKKPSTLTYNTIVSKRR